MERRGGDHLVEDHALLDEAADIERRARSGGSRSALGFCPAGIAGLIE
jgi:hypothetical protein